MNHDSRPSRPKPDVLAADLDGTLIPLAGNDQNALDLQTLSQQFEQSGVVLTFVTGRHLEIVEQAIERHQLPLPEWIICDVGSTIYQRRNDRWEPLAAYRDHLRSLCNSLPVHELRDQLQRFEGLRLQEPEKQGEFKLSYYVDQAKLPALSNTLGEWLATNNAPYTLIDSVDPFTGDGLIDLLPLGVSKAYAIEWWRELCGFEKAQVVFAGDSGNDYAALVAGYRSIVVGNADRRLAQRVLEYHGQQGWSGRLQLVSAPATSGVLEGCRAFGLFPDGGKRPVLGATVVGESQTEFAVWAPGVNAVDLQLESDDSRTHHPLQPVGGGYFERVIDDVGPGTRYAFRLDESVIRPDPASRYQPEGVHGPSEVVDPRSFEWHDEGWRGRPTAELVIYELHIGTFTSPGTFLAAVDHLPKLVELGITAVEVMPVAQAPGGWNWGYDGVNLFAPNHNYGTPDDFRAFVDAAHEAGLGVILDVVYNHLGPEGNYLAEFGPYFSSRHHTPWGEAFNFDGPDSESVRQYIIENALRWLDEYHLDGLRLDAVHSMIDDSDVSILSEIRLAVTEYAATVDRQIHLIAESNRYDAALLGPVGNIAPYEAIWCDDIMHSIYSHLAPEVKHTPRPYIGVSDLVESMEYGFIYTGPPETRVTEQMRSEPPLNRATEHVTSLLIALQNHDVVGNDPHGRRFHQLTSTDTQRAAAALVLLYPSIPLIFMGEEFATHSRFHFFTDFGDEHLRQGVVLGRQQEYPDHLDDEHMSPVDSRSFAESKLPDVRKGAMWNWYQALLQTRGQWQNSGRLNSLPTVECNEDLDLFTLQYRNPDEPCHFVVARLCADSGSGDGCESMPIEIAINGKVLLDSRTSSHEESVSDDDRILIRPNHAIIGVGEITL